MRPAALLLLALAACASARPGEEFNRALSTPDPAKALAHLDRAIAADPRPEYFAERARIHLALRRRPEALADYAEALKRTPADELGSTPRAGLFLRRALLLSSLGRAAEADADLSEALKLAPELTEARLERARLRRAAGRREEADRDVEAARRTGAGQADFFYNEAVRAITNGEEAEGDRMIGFALDLDPGYSRAHVARARRHLEHGRFAEAELYYHRGGARLSAGEIEAALGDFEKASDLDPKEARYLAARGLAKFRAGRDVAEVRADLDAAIRADDACYPAWFNRGLVAFERKEYEDAEKDLRHAAALRATPEGSVALARVLHERGNTEAALNLLRRALDVYRTPEVLKVLRDEIERMGRAKETKP